MEMDFPVLDTDAQLGKLTLPDGSQRGILNMSTILTRATFTFDRSQLISLGSEILKMAEKMPKDKSQPTQLQVVERGGLLVPDGSV